MKKYIFIFLMTVISNFGFAQNKKGDNGLTMFKMSINSGNLRWKSTADDDYNSSKSRIGFGIGIERLTQLKKETVYLGTQISLNRLGYKGVKTTYITVPLTLNIMLGKNKLWYVGAGVYGGYMLTGKYRNSNDDWVKMKIGNATTDNRTRTDYGFIYTIASTFGEGLPIIQLHIMSGKQNLIPEARQTNGAKNKMNSIELALRIPLNVMNKLKK